MNRAQNKMNCAQTVGFFIGTILGVGLLLIRSLGWLRKRK